jgi:hypothetical protein
MVRRLREIPPPVPLSRHRETLDRSEVRTDGEDGERCRMERGAGWGGRMAVAIGQEGKRRGREGRTLPIPAATTELRQERDE